MSTALGKTERSGGVPVPTRGPRATGGATSLACGAILLAFVAGVVRGALRKDAGGLVPGVQVREHSDADVDAVLKALDTPARRRALDGAWVVVNGDATGFSSSYTQPLAISIEGDRAREWDGRTIVTSRVKLTPCELTLMRKRDGDEGESGSIRGYVVHDGVAELVAGGDVGERVGDGAVVCADHFAVFVLDDDGRCARINSYDTDGLRAHDRGTKARCGFRRDAGKDVFYYEKDPFFVSPGEAKEGTLPVDGWRIGERPEPDADDVNAKLLHRYTDFDAARAVVDADARANDPLLIATAAGGKAGDTGTVAGLIATFASDRRSLDEKVVRITGLVVAHASRDPEDRDDTLDTITLAVPGHRELTISCRARNQFAREVTDGTIVVVEGTVGASNEDWTKRPFAVPELDPCTLVAAP